MLFSVEGSEAKVVVTVLVETTRLLSSCRGTMIRIIMITSKTNATKTNSILRAKVRSSK